MAGIKPTTGMGGHLYGSTSVVQEGENTHHAMWMGLHQACQTIAKPVSVTTIAAQQGLAGTIVEKVNKTQYQANTGDAGLTQLDVGTHLTTHVGSPDEASIDIQQYHCDRTDQNYGIVT